MAAKKEPNDYPRVTIRIPEWLRDAVECVAERDRRSMSNWIVLALEEAVRMVALRNNDVAAIIKVPTTAKRKRR